MAQAPTRTLPGDEDMARAVAGLSARLPDELQPLGEIAYNLRWSWDPDGDGVFSAIDPERWDRIGQNPVRLLAEVSPPVLAEAATDRDLVERIGRLAERLREDRLRPARPGASTDEHPTAFLCAEFGLHPSLPIYSGGLGVLAGDIIKEASDMALPMVGVGLLYRNGYFHQRLDSSGMQHEYWVDTDPALAPCVRVTGADGTPLSVSVPLTDDTLTVHVWRVDVGRVPVYLLDTDVPTNSTVGRWVTARLYDSNHRIRLAQYAVLGVGAARALDALGIRPGNYHLNEGHPALIVSELAARAVAAGTSPDDAWDTVRDQLVFTTHTPVPAGNETYETDQVLDTLAPVLELAGPSDVLLSRAGAHDGGPQDQRSLTALALRSSRSANGVSERHGEVARAMWQPLFGSAEAADVPIGHVTNGVHVPTWLRGPMRQVLDRHLGEDWLARADSPETWAPLDDIPDAELWEARNEARASFVSWLRRRAVEDRLRRGEDTPDARSIEQGLDEHRLTIGFARRLATYKRLHLLAMRPDRATSLASGAGGIQLVFAGKAHPADDAGKELVRELFQMKDRAGIGNRIAFVEDYDLASAQQLIAGCDVWVNVPRPPQEASGTSGMKSVLNGGLQLSVLDGWWAEAYDGTNGWAIDGEVDADERQQDERHADALFGLLEDEVVPTFHDRGDEGVPHGWVAMMKASLRTNGPRFSAKRMVSEYADRVYAGR